MSSSIGPNIVTDGLVLFFDMANMDSFNVSTIDSDYIFYDLSEQKNNHSLGSMFGLTPSQNFYYNPNRFNYNDWFLQGVPISPRSFYTTGSTVTIYSKISQDGYWLSNAPPNSLPGPSFFLSQTTDSVYSHIGCGSPINYIDTTLVTSDILDGNWHMYEAKNVNFTYVFHANSWNSFCWFGNLLNENSIIMLYNRNLTDIESLQNYNALKGRFKV